MPEHPFVVALTGGVASGKSTVAQRFAEMGGTPGGNTPAEFAAMIDKERESWKQTVEAAKLSME